jgi:hypothetical protein
LTYRVYRRLAKNFTGAAEFFFFTLQRVHTRVRLTRRPRPQAGIDRAAFDTASQGLRRIPIFLAVELIAARADGWSWRCSATIRTARSRASGENQWRFGVSATVHTSEPPGIQGRFNSTLSGESEMIDATLHGDSPCFTVNHGELP